MKRLIAARRISQIFFLVLFIYILWSTTYPLKGLLPPGTFFKINPLIMIITSISERVIVPGISVSLVMLILTLILGRFFCGWVCPLGTTIDMTAAIGRKKYSEDDRVNRNFSMPKFLVLIIVAMAAILGVQLAWFMDPMVIMARFVSLNLIPTVTFIINSGFMILIKYLHLYGPVQDLYRALKPTILGINVYYFSHSGIIFLVFVFVCLLTLVKRRLWCRSLCPLGALYAVAARSAFLRRRVAKCVQCGKCKSDCRMGAIKDDMSYAKGECILCMDCIYDCPGRATSFRFIPPKQSDPPVTKAKDERSGISRREFIFLAMSSILLMGFRFKKNEAKAAGSIIRPPAALKEEDFLNRCIRCGNCMKVCITNGLQPVLFQTGLEGIWTPQLVPEIGYCEYQCTLCGNTCPTGAIPPLPIDKKRLVRLGLAEIDRSICIPWAEGKQCIVCQEHCPVAQKAIKLESGTIGGSSVLKPYIDENLCIGCGICQNKCPVRPVRAVRVYPRNSDRT